MVRYNVDEFLEHQVNQLFLSILQPVRDADFIVPVEIDGSIHQVSTLNVFIKGLANQKFF